MDGTSLPNVTAGHIANIVAQADGGKFQDFEYAERQGIVHISRFVPDETLNEMFQ